jgi:hypothetical protein
VFGAAVHDAVTHRDKASMPGMAIDKGKQGVQHLGKRGRPAFRPTPVNQLDAGGILGSQARRRPKARNLAADRGRQRASRILAEHGELEAGRPGVEGEDRACHLVDRW